MNATHVYIGEVITEAEREEIRSQQDDDLMRMVNDHSAVNQIVTNALKKQRQEISNEAKARKAAAMRREKARQERAEALWLIKRTAAACGMAGMDALLFAYQMIHPAVAGVVFMVCVAVSAYLIGRLVNRVGGRHAG